MEKTRYYAYILLTTICITYFVENFLRSAAGALTPILITELSISHGAMGLLVSAYFFVYGVMQVPSGILSDAFGARKTILGFTAITVVGIFLFWASRSYELLFVAQFLVGIGCSTFYINAVKLVSTWFPVNRRATAIGILSASSGLGNTISYMGFPIAVESLGGWRNLYLWMSIILVVNWVMNIFILKDRDELQIASPHLRNQPILQSLVETLKDKRLYPFLAGFILSSTGWVFMNWMPQFLIDARGFTYFEVGQIASLGTIAGIPGCIAVAAVSDRLRKRKTPLIAFSAIYVALLIVFMNLPGTVPLVVFGGLSFLMSFAASFWVLYFSMIPETLPPEQAGIGLGLVNGMGTIGFSVITPIYGALVDRTGSYFMSNTLIQILSLLMPVIFALFIKECYGGVNDK
ncbi:MAG: MFS transporter [Candidatus Bathyarchaeota archaeon]|nr:MFS transporter [Candidatus Bathyarchaeota archaeon]